MYKRRRAVAGSFKQPVPFNGATGQFAQIGNHGPVTRLAMVQICEADTHTDYVVCIGSDPETGRVYTNLCVAKPYGKRVSGGGTYNVGEVYAAAKVRTKIGDTPGVAATSTGHPADLNEVVDALQDSSGNPIAWILLDSGGAAVGPVVIRYDGTASPVTLTSISGSTPDAIPFNTSADVRANNNYAEIVKVAVGDANALQFVSTGLYKIEAYIRASWTSPNQPAIVTSANTGTTDAHSHTYDTVDASSASYYEVLANYQYKRSGGAWTSVSVPSFYDRVTYVNNFRTIPANAVINFLAGDRLRVAGYTNSSGSGKFSAVIIAMAVERLSTAMSSGASNYHTS